MLRLEPSGIRPRASRGQRVAQGAIPRRFPPPWSIEESSACFVVRDGDKQALAYVYFENEPGRHSSAKLLTRDEAFLVALNIAKLPSVPRQILKDIPRPPNSASRDD